MLCLLEVIDYDKWIIMCINIFHRVDMSNFRLTVRRPHESRDRRSFKKSGDDRSSTVFLIIVPSLWYT